MSDKLTAKEIAAKWGKRAFLVAMVPLAFIVGVFMGLAEMCITYRDMWTDTDSWVIKP